MNPGGIRTFLDAVRSRLDGDVRWRLGSRVFLAAAIMAVSWALVWRVFGYAAPRVGYGVIFGLALVGGGGWILLSRRSLRDAAHAADRVFDLKDGLISWMDFRNAHCDGEVYQLNERDLASRLDLLDVNQVPVCKPRRVLVTACLLSIVALVMSLLPHSLAVRERLAREQMIAGRSAEIEKQVEDVVEEIIKSMSEEERELINPSTLREWVKQLEVTKDARENEKQLARLEQQISKAMQGLEARQDEAVLKLAADELAKSSMADARRLGKQIEAKQFDMAAQEMKDMKALAEHKKLTPEEMEKLRQRVAKSKEMAKRMADGARRKDFGKIRRGDNRDAEPGRPQDDQQGMEEMLEELDADARQLANELEEGEEDDGGLEEAAGRFDQNADKLGRRLSKLGARQKAKGRLNALRQGLGEARQFAQGKSASLGLAQSQSPNAGGLEPGKGTDQTRREERDEFKDNGNLTEIKGNPNGDGPSSSSVESADSGSGIAGRASVAKERQFKQQFESLVHRDDIPESLKLGVREYFETVHETESSEK